MSKNIWAQPPTIREGVSIRRYLDAKIERQKSGLAAWFRDPEESVVFLSELNFFGVYRSTSCHSIQVGVALTAEMLKKAFDLSCKPDFKV